MLSYPLALPHDSLVAQIPSALLFLAFALTIYATLRLRTSAVGRFASIPLSDRPEDPRDGR